MSMIRAENLTFAYPASYDNIFEDVDFQIDTNWKLGLIGRNGRGKTTLLRLLSGGYEYQYLGQPFGLDNLLGGTKIATGSYTGTGKYGPSNPNSLTLDFVPQLILIFWAHSGGNAPNAIAWLSKDMGFSYKPAGSNGQWYYTYPITVLPPNGTDMRWYSPADVSAQMNGSGVEYRYFAIG